jgi:hypothetical protein
MAPETGVGDSLTAVATIAAKNYIARVRVLADSLAAHHPELPLFFMLTDEIEGCFEAAEESFTLIRFADFADRDASLSPLAFAYDRKTLAAASKPLLLRFLLDQGFSRVLFVDPDMLLLDRIDGVLRQLEDFSILLCPHRLRPPSGDDRVAADLGLLQSGTYNAGLLGVRESEPARAFIEWWWGRLRRHCRKSPQDGFHFDQRWLDLVPGLFSGVGLVKDPEINVGWWNFDERPLSVIDRKGGPSFSGCRLFHASGYEPDRPGGVSVHASWLGMEQVRSHAELFAHYHQLLEAAGQSEASQWPYAFGDFDNVVPIPDIVRDIYLDLDESAGHFGDPFVTQPATSFFRWLREPAQAMDTEGAPISNLWFEIYQRRSDVQFDCPDISGEDRGRFLRWTSDSGVREHDIPEALCV